MDNLHEKVNVSLDYILKHIQDFNPEIGIILGTGLGGLINNKDVDDIQILHKIDYSDIPHFPISTVESHHGNLLVGYVSGKPCLIMQGRFHYYEGYNMEQVTFPVYIMKSLGICTLLVSNACGAVNPIYQPGDLMIMRDHINYLFDTPLKGLKRENINKRMYDEGLIELGERIALENKIKIRKGVYLSLRGPTLETRSEYRMIRKMGADVVGMSTIPEVLLSGTNGMRVFGISVVTDTGFPDTLKPATLEEILKTAAISEPNLVLLMKKLIKEL